MPIYDYLCSACGHRTEVIHGIHEDAPRFCPSCGAEGTLRKGFSMPAILFKGSGWAKKDRSATRTSGSASSEKSGEKGTEASKPGGPDAGSDAASGDKPASSTSSTSSTSSASSTAAD